MFYKPHYCCQCGEKIDRPAWHFWTSRKFCELCETEFPAQRWLPLGLVAVSIGGLLFGFGAYLTAGESAANGTAPRSLAMAGSKNAADQKNAQLFAANSVQNNGARQIPSPVAVPIPSVAGDSPDPSRAKNLRLVKGENPQTAAAEPVYYCGAQTKKGSPCTRRVKGGAKRCWQHAGLPAMLPAEKLAATQ